MNMFQDMNKSDIKSPLNKSQNDKFCSLDNNVIKNL
jgi:hypothetical protein